jgi:hypothetical protein
MLLPFLQLATCAVDITGQQGSIMLGFCLVTGSKLWDWVAIFVALAMFASLPLGFLSLRFKALVPLYLLLLGLSPLLLVVHGRLLSHHVFECDAP